MLFTSLLLASSAFAMNARVVNRAGFEAMQQAFNGMNAQENPKYQAEDFYKWITSDFDEVIMEKAWKISQALRAAQSCSCEECPMSLLVKDMHQIIVRFSLGLKNDLYSKPFVYRPSRVTSVPQVEDIVEDAEVESSGVTEAVVPNMVISDDFLARISAIRASIAGEPDEEDEDSWSE